MLIMSSDHKDKESKPELDNALALVDAELAVVLDGIKQVFEIH